MDTIQVIPFCVPLTRRGADAAGGGGLGAEISSGESNGVGVVGTITLRGQSAIVWFGWGTVERKDNDKSDNNGRISSSVGTGRPPMGSLSLSMPASTRIGPSIPTSQLIGGSSEEDMMLGQQISARLAKRIGWPVFVSCSFSDHGGGDSSRQDGISPAMAAGFDDSAMPAVLAEKEIARILMEEKAKQ
jgi:hypothetical protein